MYELYETDNAYVDLINKDLLFSIAKEITNPSFVECCANSQTISYIKDDDDSKKLMKYKIEFIDDSDYTIMGRKIVLSCSDGRRLVIDLSSVKKYGYLNIIYKLDDKNDIRYQFKNSISTFKHSASWEDLIDEQESIDFIQYNNFKFKKTLLPYCRVVNRYGKVKESKEMINLHKSIIDKIVKNRFSDNELNIFLEKIDRALKEAGSKKLFYYLLFSRY